MTIYVKFQFDGEEEELIREWAYGVPITPLLRRLVMRTIRRKFEPSTGVRGGSHRGAGRVPQGCGEGPTGVSQNVHTPETPPGRVPGTLDEIGTEHAIPDPEEEKKKKEKEKRRQERAEHDSMVLGIAGRVIGLINKHRPSKPGSRGFGPGTYVKQIGKILKLGFTEADMVAVIESRAAEGDSSGEWKWFKPATLLREGSFGEKLDEARSGVLDNTKPNGQPQSRMFPGEDYTGDIMTDAERYSPERVRAEQRAGEAETRKDYDE
jgi:hypothetical protein